ncbi:MAG: protein phosphatase 2C domain-containing protein [candidate division WOR-3 bacterium]
MTKFKAVFATNIGLKRENNEDSLLVDDMIFNRTNMEVVCSHRFEKNKTIFSVADGIGGNQGGEIASRIVLEHLRGYIIEKNDKKIEDLIKSSKIELENISQNNERLSGLGTTVAGIAFDKEKIVVFNVGDSRVYKLSGKYLERLSKDHSVLEMLKDNGVTDKIENVPHNVITSSISGDGIENIPQIYVIEKGFEKGDTFLVCSDGLWDSIEIDVLEEGFQKENLEETGKFLLEKALKNGGKDNITFIIVRCLDE